MTSPWFYLVLAGLFEIIWAVGLKRTAGFARLGPSLWVLAALVLSFWFLALAARTLPIGTAYAVWTGIGVVGAVLLGMILYGESADWRRLLCVGLIVAGIIGLKLQPEPS